MSVAEISPAAAPTRAAVKRLVRIAISAAILGGLAAKTDWNQVSAAIRGLRWSLALGAFLVLIAAQIVSAVRWQWLARPLGFDGSLWRYINAYFVGMFFNLLLPTSVGGDAIRAVYLNARSGCKVAAVLSVLLDRLSGLLVLLAVACVATIVCPVPLPAWVKLAVGGAAAAAVIGLSISPWMTTVVARLDVAGDGRWHRLLGKVSRLAASMRSAMSVYRREPRLIVSSTALSAIVQASSVLQVGLLGMAIGLDVPWAVYGVAAPMVALLTLLPVSLNGMGVREAGMVVFLAPAGVSSEKAMMVAFLWFLAQTAAGLLGAGVYALNPRSMTGGQLRAEAGNDDAIGPDSDQGRAGQRRSAA
jgi:glycosyltransferase 2 family protein